MKPFLFEDTWLETPTYYVLYLFSFLGAIILGVALSRRKNLNPVRAIDLGMVSFVAGIIGARLFHIFFEHPEYYILHPIRIFYLWQGGFVLYGGLIVGALGGVLFLKRQGDSWRRWADLAVGPIFLGMGLGRFGCLASGCCYGKPTDLFWGLVFTDPRGAAPLHVPLHPTQLIEAAVSLFLAGLFSWIYLYRYEGRSGRLFFTAVIVYSLLRFLMEYLRGDVERGIYLNGLLSTSQLISIAALVFAAVMLARSKPT